MFHKEQNHGKGHGEMSCHSNCKYWKNEIVNKESFLRIYLKYLSLNNF